MTLDPAAPLTQAFRDAVSAEIQTFLASQQPVLRAMGPELVPMHQAAETLLAGGKRLRPAFCVWGYVAAAGASAGELRPVLAAAASLELLHVSALVHDDVMDASDRRRGQPAAHRQFEALHIEHRWTGDAAAFGRAAAILLGDLLLMWSAQLIRQSGLPATALERALPIVEAMRTEVTGGQYLDVVAQARPLREPGGSDRGPSAVALADIGRVVEYKSARYTVQRPAQMGAAIGGGSEELHAALGAYGSALGRAFQYRDDLLGVFGDPAVTGKPAGDDLREGKRTVLIEHAFAQADSAGRALLRSRLGDPDLDRSGVAALRQVITASGAQEAVEEMISAGRDEALAALAGAHMTEEGRTALTVLAEAAVRRDW